MERFLCPIMTIESDSFKTLKYGSPFTEKYFFYSQEADHVTVICPDITPPPSSAPGREAPQTVVSAGHGIPLSALMQLSLHSLGVRYVVSM